MCCERTGHSLAMMPSIRPQCWCTFFVHAPPVTLLAQLGSTLTGRYSRVNVGRLMLNPFRMSWLDTILEIWLFIYIKSTRSIPLKFILIEVIVFFGLLDAVRAVRSFILVGAIWFCVCFHIHMGSEPSCDYSDKTESGLNIYITHLFTSLSLLLAWPRGKIYFFHLSDCQAKTCPVI